MYTNNRDAYRQAFFIAWQKHQQNLPLEPIEAQLIEIMLEHPEYQRLLEKSDAYQGQEFELEENPFVHMSLHLAIREQIRMNRPTGIASIFQQLQQKYPDAEHRIMTCLAQMMWSAQQTGAAPSEEEYLDKIRGL